MAPATLLLLTFLATLAAGLGALLGTQSWIATAGVGWLTAAAAGLMLGAGYVLLLAGQSVAPIAALLGAAVGLLLMRLTDSVPASSGAPGAGGRVSLPPATNAGALRASALHSAAEGIAIGAAAAFAVPFAEFLLLTFAVHNVTEGAVLGARLTGRGHHPGRAALLAIGARASQPVGAVGALLLARAFPALLPGLSGASFGALLYLIVAELLPQSYQQAGRTSIAVVVSLAAGMVALMGVGP